MPSLKHLKLLAVTLSVLPLLSSLLVNDAQSNTFAAKHIIIIVLENAAYGSVYGSSSAPYMTSIANQYTLLTNYHGVSHPSLPNYLAMIAGSTFGITDDKPPSYNTGIAGKKEVTALMLSKNITWKAYMESMPTPCDSTSSGLYAVKHDPFLYFKDVTADSHYCKEHVVSFNVLNYDIANNHLPNYAFIVPNLNDDGHNTSISYADTWLKGFLPKLINSPSFASSVIFVTYDEDHPETTTNHIYTSVVSPLVKNGYRSVTYYNHYSLLATVESIYSLGNLGRNDASATVISDIFK